MSSHSSAAHPSLVVTGAHPRLMITSMEDLRERTLKSPPLRRWYQVVKERADSLLGTPVLAYEKVGHRLLAVSREALQRVYFLATVFAVEGDPRYKDRLSVELSTLAAFPDWNHAEHFLDTAEMTHAFAVAYDWLFDAWSEEERALFRAAIVEHGLRPGLEQYGAGDRFPWPELTNNWNIVCNSGLCLGALAVADDEPELASRILDEARRTIWRGMGEFAPSGGYAEGVGYWGYATKYLVPLIAALRTATGDDFGLSKAPGMSETGYFPLYLSGPSGQMFNYYDGWEGEMMPPELFWFAEEYNEPELTRLGLRGLEKGIADWIHLTVALLWYEAHPDQETESASASLSLDHVFPRVEVAAMRSSWDDPDGVYAAVKGGDNTTNHGDLDLGTFVLEALGQRWAIDLGPDDYDLPGYWDRQPGGARWGLYRKRAEGQNTVVVDPGWGEDQEVSATGTIVGSLTREATSCVVLDLSRSHPLLSSWRRGVGLFNDRKQVVVKDEIRLEKAADLWWFLHTRATIAISTDGTRARLEQGGKTMIVEITSHGAQFVSMEARPLWFSPDPEGQNENDGIRKLAIRLSQVTEAEITVQFTPLDGSPRRRQAEAPLSRWLEVGIECRSDDPDVIGRQYTDSTPDELPRDQAQQGTLEVRIASPEELLIGESAHVGVQVVGADGELLDARFTYEILSSPGDVIRVGDGNDVYGLALGSATIVAVVTLEDRTLLHARAPIDIV